MLKIQVYFLSIMERILKARMSEGKETQVLPNQDSLAHSY